jgi:ribosomal protein L32
LEKKNNKITATGILGCNVMSIDDNAVEWLDARDFSIAALAGTIGINLEHKAKASITLEIVEQPCELCGQLATGHQLCDECGKVICDNCSKSDAAGRYCPVCFDLRKKPETL